MQLTKMHGLGNDFLIYNPRQQDEDMNELAKQVCARRLGAGADGLMVVLPSDKCDIRMRIINSDGSEAEMCGNGIRCFAKYVYEKGIVKNEEMTVETLAGTIRPKLIIENEQVAMVAVDMGKPILQPKQIPIITDEDIVLNKPIMVNGETYHIACANTGVPHTMVFVDKIDEAVVETIGPIIEKLDMFPKNTNVNFVEVIDKDNIAVSTWERGAGKTLACGTGCCAAGVVCYLNGYTNRKVSVKLTTGVLDVEYKQDETVMMTGPATTVYEGVYFL
jgi:diaminopimelate epimerase